MLMTEAPVGEIISFIHKHPKTVSQDKLVSKVEQIVGLITFLVQKKGIIDAADSLINDLFVLRLELLRNPDLLNQLLNNIDGTLQDSITKQLNSKPSFLEIEKAYINALSIYKDVTSSVTDKVLGTVEFDIQTIPSYDDFATILQSLPTRESYLLQAFIRASLIMDFSLIASDLVLSSDLKIPSKEREVLARLIKNSVEDFAVHASIFGLWSPNEEDESAWIRNIKIRVSHISSSLQTNRLTFINSDQIERELVG